MPVSGVLAVAVAGLCMVSVVGDLRFRRIPNALTLTALGAALALHLAFGGLSGLGLAALGGLIAGVPMVILWRMGGIGGGDVKFMAAAGAFLGPVAAVWAVLLGGVGVGVAAAVVTALVAWRGGYLHLFLWNPLGLVRRGHTFAMAVPLAAGVVAALWLHG